MDSGLINGVFKGRELTWSQRASRTIWEVLVPDFAHSQAMGTSEIAQDLAVCARGAVGAWFCPVHHAVPRGWLTFGAV